MNADAGRPGVGSSALSCARAACDDDPRTLETQIHFVASVLRQSNRTRLSSASAMRAAASGANKNPAATDLAAEALNFAR